VKSLAPIALTALLALSLAGCAGDLPAIPNPFSEPTPIPRRPTATPAPTASPTVAATPTVRATATPRVAPTATPLATTTPVPFLGEPARDNGWEITVGDVKRFKALGGGNANGVYWIVLFTARNQTKGPRRLDMSDFSLVGGGRSFAASAEGTERAVRVYRRQPLSEPIGAEAAAESVVVFDIDEQAAGLWLRVFTPMVVALQPPPPPPPPTVSPNKPQGGG
jgi:hypothetical protein